MGGEAEGQSRISTVDEDVFVAVQQRGWMCTEKELWLACGSAGNITCGRAHSPTGMLWFLLLNSLMSSLRIVETQKSQSIVSGIDGRDTGLFSGKTDVTVWDPNPVCMSPW